MPYLVTIVSILISHWQRYRPFIFLKAYSLFSRLLPVQLSKPYQFKTTIRETIPENTKSFKLNGKPQSWTQTFFGWNSNTIFFKQTNKMSCKLICKKMLIFAIYCVSYMIFNMFFTKLEAKIFFMITVLSIKKYCLKFNDNWYRWSLYNGL